MTHGTVSVKSIMQLGTGSAGCGSSLTEAKAMLPKPPHSCKGVHCSLSFTKSMRSNSIHTAARAGKSHFFELGGPLFLHHVRVLTPDKNCCTRTTRVGATIAVRRTESDWRARERSPECARKKNDAFVSISRLPQVHPARPQSVPTRNKGGKRRSHRTESERERELSPLCPTSVRGETFPLLMRACRHR